MLKVVEFQCENVETVVGRVNQQLLDVVKIGIDGVLGEISFQFKESFVSFYDICLRFLAHFYSFL